MGRRGSSSLPAVKRSRYPDSSGSERSRGCCSASGYCPAMLAKLFFFWPGCLRTRSLARPSASAGCTVCSIPRRDARCAGTCRGLEDRFRLLTFLWLTLVSREQCCPSCIIWKWFTGITKPIFFFFFFFFLFLFGFCSGCFRKLTQERWHKRAKNGVGVRDLIFKQLEWFLLFFKRCTCLWYCLSSEMITAPLLYWYNIVHASVVFLYSSLKFINLYCRCYVFLWQNSLQKFFKVF